MANQIVDFYRQENPGTGLTDDGITLHYAEQYADQLPNLLKDYPDFGRDYNRIYDEAFPLTAGERAKQALGSFVKGVAGTVASIPEAVGIARAEAFGRGLGVGTTDYRETLMGQLAEGIRSVGDMASPEVAEAKAERLADSFWNTKVFSAVGSGVGFLGTGGVTGLGVRTAVGAGLKKKAGDIARKEGLDRARSMPAATRHIAERSGKAAGERYLKKKAALVNTGSVAVLGSLANATAGYKDALANGGSPDQALSSYLLSGVVGTSEAIPLGRMLNRLDDASGGTFMYYLANAAPEALEETLQEAAQGVAGDIIAANIVKYDPDREMFKDLEEDAAAGGISGTLLSLVTSALTRKTKAITDAKVGKFVEGEGVVEGTGEETVEDAKARYTGGDEEGIKQLAIRVASQLEADPTGSDNEAWGELKKIQGELIGDDPDARMIFDAEFFKANQRRAADRVEKVINTKFGEVSNPERGRYRAGEEEISETPQSESIDTQLVSPEELVGTEYEPSVDIAGEEDVDIFGNVKTAQQDKVDPDAEANFAEFKAQLLEQRNALVGELMDVRNDLALLGFQRALLDTRSNQSIPNPEETAANVAMLEQKREELAGQIQAINAEVAGIEQRVREVGRFQPEISLVEEPVAARGLEDRVGEATDSLETEQWWAARERETRQELERLEKEELDTAEKQQYWDDLAQELADDRDAIAELQEKREAELDEDIATVDRAEQELKKGLEELEATATEADKTPVLSTSSSWIDNRWNRERKGTSTLEDLKEEVKQELLELFEFKQELLQKRQAGVTAEMGLSRDQLARLYRFTEGDPKGITTSTSLVSRRTEGGRTVGPQQGKEALERRKARLEKTIKDKFRKGWSFKAGKFVSKPISKKEKETAQRILDQVNADLKQIEGAGKVTRSKQQKSHGELLASIKGHKVNIGRLRKRLEAGETTFKGTGLSIAAAIEANEKRVEELTELYKKKKTAAQAAAVVNNEDNAKKANSIAIESGLERAKNKRKVAAEKVDRLVENLEAATPQERSRITKEWDAPDGIKKLQNQIDRNNDKIDNLEVKEDNAKTKPTQDKFRQQADVLREKNVKLNRDLKQMAGGLAGLTAEESLDPNVTVPIPKKSQQERVVTNYLNSNQEVTKSEHSLRDQRKRHPLDVRNVEIIHSFDEDPNKQDRELKAGPAYYEVGTSDLTQETLWGREATETLRKYKEATTNEERTKLAQQLASQMARGAAVSATSGETRRLISFVGPDKKIWVLGVHRSGKDKTSYSLVPPKTDPRDKVGYEGVLFEDLLAQGYIPFASIRLRNATTRMAYGVDTVEKYKAIVETIKKEVVSTPAFMEQTSLGSVTTTVSLDAIVENVEPVFENAGTITETEDSLEKADQPAASEERAIYDLEQVEDVPVAILTEEGAGNVFDILNKVDDTPAEVVVNPEKPWLLQKEDGISSIEEAIDEVVASDEQLDNLVETLGKASATKGIRFVEFLTDHILKIYEENAGSKEAFVKAFLGSDSAQEIGEQIRAEAFNAELKQSDANRQVDEVAAKEAEADPNSREDTVPAEGVAAAVPVDKPFMSVPLGFGATGRTAGYSSFDRVCEVCTGKVMELAKKMGLPVTYAVIDAKSPVMEGNISHWVAVVNIDGQLYVVDDPQTNLIENAPELPKVDTQYVGPSGYIEQEGQARVIKETFDPVLIPITKEALEAAYGQTVRKEEVATKGVMKGEVIRNGYNQVEGNIETITKAAAEIGGVTEVEEAPAPTLNIEINIDGATVRLTNEQAEDPAFRKKNRLAPLVYMVDEKTKKKIPVPASSEDKVRLRGYAPDRPDNAYPRVSQRKLNKIFNYLIERMRALGVQVEITDKEFVNASTKAKAMFGFANGKPVIVLAMNSLENPTTQNLFDLLHEIGHAATADLPQEARLRVLAAISKLNDAVLRIPGRKFKYSIDEAESLEEVEQEERLVEAIASALMSENFDPTTANTLSRKIVKFFRDLMMAVKQAFHRMMGHEGQVAMNYFKVQVEAMLTGNHAPAYLSWVSGYKYSISDRMSSMDLVESDSIIDSTHDLSTFSKEYKIVVGDSPEAVEHNIRWAGIRFTADRPELTDVDRAVARMEAQRTIAANNALNDILDDLYNTVKRVGGSRLSYLSKEAFVKKLTKNRIPDERIKKALEVSQDPSLANTQMQDLEAEEARKSAGVELDRYLRAIQTSLENLSKDALNELNVNNLDSTQVAHDQLKAKNIALAAKYEDLSFVQGLIAGVSDELVKKRNERADGKIDVVLKELGVKATEAEIEAALKSLREKKLVDSIELLSTEITEWGKGEAKVIQKRIEALGDPRLDVFKDPATLALTISTARHQPALMGLLAVRRAGEMEGMKQVLNKAIRDAASGNTEGLLDGWDSVVGGKSRTAMFERLTTKARKALAAVIQTEEARRNAHLTLEKYEDDVLLDEKLGDPLNRYIEEVGTVFGKENILPEWLVNADGSRPKEWVASHGAMYVVPPNPKSSITDLKNKANHKKLNLREISNIGQMVQDIEKMNAWLLEQPVESRGGEYNMVKRMVDRMTEVQAIQYHRELGNSFVVRLMGSLTDKLEMVGTPAAVKIAAQLKRFAYYIASYAGSGTKSAVHNGKIWSEKMIVAMNKVNGAGGDVDLKSFKQKFYGPAMQYFHHRRDILNDARDRESGENKLINSWLNYLAAKDKTGRMKPIVRAASAELKAFYKQTAVNSRQIAEVSSKMGVLVYDEKGEYFRERIGSSISTTMRQTNSIAKGVYDFISPIWGRNIANKETLMAMSEEEFADYVQARFDNQRTIDEFATPIVARPGSSVFRYPDGGALNRDVVTDSLKKHPKDMVGFINELTERAGVEAEEVKEFQVGIIQRFQSFYTKLNDVVEQQETTKGFLGGKRAVPIHVMMDARKFNDFPLEWVDYAEFTERRMYQYVKNLAAESAFGRDMVQVDNDFAMAQNDIESASSLHDQIEKDINRLGFLSRLNPWARRNYNKKYDERAAELQQGRAKTYSGKMLRQSTQTQRLLNGIQESFRSYMAKERDSALEFTVWNELIRAMTGLVVQSPGTALVDTIAIVEQPWRKMGINRYGFKMMLNNITGSFGIGAGSFFQVFNKTIKFAHDDMAKMMELGLDDGTAHLEGGWFKRLRTEFRANMADEMVSKNMLTRGVEKTSRGIRSLLETGIGRAEEGQGAFPVFRPQAIFSQIAKQSSMANTIATWKMFRNFIANAADYIEAHPEAMELYKSKGMIFNENALGKSGLDKALAEMGYGKSFLFFNNSKAYHHMYNTLIEGGFNLEKVALDYIERRKSDSKADPLDAGYAPDNSLLMALAHTTQSQVMLETDVTTRAPGFLTNPIMYASMPLLGWSVQKFVDINKSMMNDRNAYGSFLGTVEGMKAYLAILPVGMVYAFLRDEYDEEILGKKSSLQSGKGLFFKGDGMPSIEEFQTDTYNSLQVAVERFDRVGIFGFGGEIANSVINDESARELSVDSRVYALNTLRNARRVLTALALQRPQNATYATIYRPVIQNLGGNGFLQYAQILNNALAKTGSEPLFEQEYAMAQRIGTNNFLRAAGRYLDLDVRTFSGTRGITTTRMRPWVSDMLMASITDDQVWFDTSWRRAVEEAEAMGKTDPEDSVKRSYQAYHPLRYIYQTMPSELEYLQILDSIEETSGIEGRMQVQQTIRNINDYGSLMGITPSEGKAERSPSPSTMKRQVFGDDFRKPTKQQILQSISGF